MSTETMTPTAQEWSKEMIYRSGISYDELAPDKQSVARDHEFRKRGHENRFFTDAFLDAYEREERDGLWIYHAAPSPECASHEEARAVARCEKPCPACGDTQEAGMRYMPVPQRGWLTGIFISIKHPCPCTIDVAFMRRWRVVEKEHKRFADASLSTLKPSPKSFMSLEAQQNIIDLVKAHPTDSFLFHGPPGTGKTRFLVALYRRALGERCRLAFDRRSFSGMAIWYVSAPELVNQLWKSKQHEKAQGPDSLAGIMPVAVSVSDVRNAVHNGYRPLLFLDELDKVDPFPAKVELLGSLIDAVYKCEGQVVATMNASVDRLAAKWKDDDAAMSVVRRIGMDENAHMVEFTAE